MKKNMNNPGVSVCVCTYEQKWEKLKMTLDSIICQKQVDFEVIISDDGSQINYYNEVVQYFQDKKFADYTFINSEKNTGTVQNVVRAFDKCRKQFVKFISPGDCLLEDDTLYRWIEFLRDSGKRWSFADVVSYKKDGGIIRKVSVEEHPRLKEDYMKGIDELSRWNYVVLNDIAVGAAIIVEKELLCEYLSRINGRVAYAEDNIYRLMMYDGVVGVYYPHAAILYEVGDGISTSGDKKWDKLISKDWNETNRMMAETYNPDDLVHRRVMNAQKYWAGRQ